MTGISQSFPQKVYNVLRFCEEQGREDIISWELNGTAFKVNDLQLFQRDLLPKYFNTNKYYSFTRALYAHGFTCVRTGRQPGIYSHPKFNRNDPVSPSLMRRESKKKSSKVAIVKNSTLSNSSSDALDNNRTFSLKSCTLHRQQKLQFPSLVDETGSANDYGTATAFGRSYHTIASLDVALVTSLPVETQTGSQDLTGLFHDAGVGILSYPSPTSLVSCTNPTFFHNMPRSMTTATERQTERKPIASNNSIFSLGNTHIATTMVASLQRLVTHSSEQGAQNDLILNSDASEANTHQISHEQDDRNVVAV